MSAIRVGDARLPTDHGTFRAVSYRADDGHEHLALAAGMSTEERADGAGDAGAGLDSPHRDVLVRMHSECLTGDVLASHKCDCGRQLAASLQAIDEEAAAGRAGVVVYLRGHEGRGIGLANKIRAYELQDRGLDTVDANIAQGLPVDDRSYDVAAAILRDLDIESVRLLSNNPAKAAALAAAGIAVTELVGLDVADTAESRAYLATKRARLGHTG
jgi:GTP cyclohydrolase II